MLKFGTKIDLHDVGINKNLVKDLFYYDGKTLYMNDTPLDSKQAEYICHLGLPKNEHMFSSQCFGFIHDKYVMYIGGEDLVFEQRYAEIVKEKK